MTEKHINKRLARRLFQIRWSKLMDNIWRFGGTPAVHEWYRTNYNSLEAEASRYRW